MNRPFLFMAGCLVSLVISATAQAATKRGDLSGAQYNSLFCAASAPTAQNLQLLGIYDAQVEWRRLEARPGRKPDLEALQRRAASLARAHHHLGYAAGICPGKSSGWIVSTPAPAPLKLKNQRAHFGTIDFSSCANWRMNAAADSLGRSRELAVNADDKTVTLPKDATVSLTCQPKFPRWLGPVTWFLVVPDPSTQPPHWIPDSNEPTATKFITWINRVRRAANRQPLSIHPALTEAADLLAIRPTAQHDRTLIRRAKAGLEPRKVKFVGEDRAVTATDDQAAWLLWNSPRHRDLLLSEDPNALGVVTRQGAQQMTIVIVTGTASPAAVASGAASANEPTSRQ